MPSDVLPDDAAGMLSVFILEDFFTARFGEHGERNVIDDYLKRRGWRESVPAGRRLGRRATRRPERRFRCLRGTPPYFRPGKVLRERVDPLTPEAHGISGGG